MCFQTFLKSGGVPVPGPPSGEARPGAAGGAPGQTVVTIGTQTPGEYQEAPVEQAGGPSLAALYHGSWPIDKQGECN